MSRVNLAALVNKAARNRTAKNKSASVNSAIARSKVVKARVAVNKADGNPDCIGVVTAGGNSRRFALDSNQYGSVFL